MDPRHPDAFLRLQERLFTPVNDLTRHTPWAHGFFSVYARDGVVVFAALLLVGWWIARGRRDQTTMAASLWAPVGALIALAVNQPLGRLVAEPRPYAALSQVLVLVPRTTDFAFPSDHAVMAGAVTVGTLLVSRRLGLVTGVLALLIAFARVYVGAHYPLDVVAGLILGGAVVGVTWLIVRAVLSRLVAACERTPLRPLLRAG